MDSDQRLEELFHGLTNYERTRGVSVDWSLDNMHALLDGVGELPGVWIQVGGSKGKGTTVHYLESMARAAGLRTGAFVSPHLQHVTERVRIDGEPIRADALVDALESVLDRARDKQITLSFFEAITAAAVTVFRTAALDLVVLEVGLGGRLDATTAVPVDATILTQIELEHTELLGADLEAIAGEKAHIMRSGKPVWVQPDQAVEDPLRDHAASVGAVWQASPRVSNLRDDGESFAGDLCVDDVRTGFRVSGASRFELAALALSYAALKHLLPSASLSLTPVSRPILPGRFEVMRISGDRWPVVLDGAHTPESSAQVAAELCRRFPHQPVVALFATAIGKRWEDGLSELLPVVDRFLVTALPSTPSVAPDVVAEWLRNHGEPAQVVAGPADGFEELLRHDAVRLIVGSFYLAGAVRASIESGDAEAS